MVCFKLPNECLTQSRAINSFSTVMFVWQPSICCGQRSSSASQSTWRSIPLRMLCPLLYRCGPLRMHPRVARRRPSGGAWLLLLGASSTESCSCLQVYLLECSLCSQRSSTTCKLVVIWSLLPVKSSGFTWHINILEYIYLCLIDKRTSMKMLWLLC